nr:hypothetical protein [Tanacetum cinerariifolium]
MINAQIGDLSSYTTKYQSPALIQKVFANMRRVRKGFSRVDTPLFDGMLVPQQVQDDVVAAVKDEDAANTFTYTFYYTTTSTRTYPFPITGGCIQTRGKITELDADKDVTLEEVDAEMDAKVQGRLPESQVQVYHLDLEHDQKVLSMQEIDEAEPAEVKSKDKGKEILVEEPKPLKRQAQIKQDEAFARELEAELNDNINWNEVIEQVKRKGWQDNTVMRYQSLKMKHVTEAQARKNMMYFNSIWAFLEKGEKKLEEEESKRKSKNLEQKAAKKQKINEERKGWQDNTVMRYQSLKMKHVTEAQARKNMMVYLKNMAGFKMDFFKGMTYTDIRPIFEKYFNSIWAFLEKGEKKLKEEESKRKSKNLEQKAAKKQKINEEVPVVDYQIHTENNKPYYKIIRADGTHQIIQERFASLEPENFSDDFLLNTFKTMFEKPNVEANIWRNQSARYGLAKVKSWKLLESCRFHIITFTTTQMILLVKRR